MTLVTSSPVINHNALCFKGNRVYIIVCARSAFYGGFGSKRIGRINLGTVECSADGEANDAALGIISPHSSHSIGEDILVVDNDVADALAVQMPWLVTSEHQPALTEPPNITIQAQIHNGID